MNYGKINLYDIANGPGVRVTLFVSGCRNHCRNCFNPETWDFSYGQPFDAAAEEMIIAGLRPDHIKGFTLLGGDPFEPENARDILPFVKRIRQMYPSKKFWCYSGYLYEDLVAGKNGREAAALLGLFDVLVDGRYEDALNDLTLRFRGSSNQRVIEVQETARRGEIVLWDEDSEP